MMRTIRLLLGGMAIALVAACGGGSDSTPSGPVIASIGGGGGTLEARNIQGGTLTIEVPPGALAQTTEIRVEALPQTVDATARFRVAPAGLALLSQATIRYAAPGTLAAHTLLRWRIGDDRFAMPSTQQGNAVHAQTFSLGYVFAAAAAGTTPKREQAAARGASDVRPLADADPISELEAAPVDCDAELALVNQQIASAVSVNDLDRAQALYANAQAILLACQQRDAAALQRQACSAYQGASLTAQSIAADSYGNFRDIVTPLLLTQANLRLTGAVCDAPDMDTLLQTKFDQFLEFVGSDYGRVDFAADFASTGAELRTLFRYKALCEEMGLQCDRFGNSLLPAVLDKLRAAAYRECRVNDDLSVLSAMYVENVAVRQVIQRATRERATAVRTGRYLSFANFTYEDVEADLAHCRSTLQLRVFSDAQAVPVEIESRRVELQAGNAPGQYDTLATVAVPRDGSLTLLGGIRTLECPDGSVSADELVARVNGVRIAARPANGRTFALATNPIDLVASTVMAQAGLDPSTATGFTVDVFREGPACGGVFSGALKLFSIPVVVNKIVLRMTAELPTAISTSAGLDVLVESDGSDGQFAPAPNLLVTFTPTCASVNPTSGRTDANGHLTTTVAPSDGCKTVSVKAVASANVGTPTLVEKTVVATVASPSSPLFSGTLTQVGSELVSNSDGESWNFTADVALVLRSDGTVDPTLSRASGTYRKQQQVTTAARSATGIEVCRLIETDVGTFDRVSGGGGAITLSGTGTRSYSGTKQSGATCIDGSEPPKAKAISSGDPGSNIGAPTGFVYREVLGADGTLRALDFNFSNNVSGQAPNSFVWTATLTTTGVLQRP